jgi:ferredoxin-NADP reductase
MGATRPGDRAKIDAPFGRFSCLFHPEEKTLGFIIGGIGITPVRSMLRYLHDTKQNIPVVLLYGSKTEDRILFKEELDQIAESGFPELKIVHVIENPTGDWEGESGLITKKMIRKYCGPVLLSRGYYVAGPPGMLEATIQNLRKLDIPDERIHLEIFSFAG